MGYSSDIMHDFVAREIRNIYSSYDGWTSTSRPAGTGYDTLVTLERQVNGHRELIRVLVTFERAVPSVLPEELVRPVRAADGTQTRQGYAILVPKNTDTAKAPAGLHIRFMQSFAFEGDELVWKKKPVRKAEQVTAPLPA